MSGLYPNPDPLSTNSKPVTNVFSLQVLLINNGYRAHINTEVTIVHRPGLCSPQVLEPLLTQSIQRTLQNLFETSEPCVVQDPISGCFLVTVDKQKFQENIGLHATTIKSIIVAIPYTCTTKKVDGQTKDKAYYCVSVSLFYQEQPGVDCRSRVDGILDGDALAVRGSWASTTISTLANLDLEKNLFYAECLRGTQASEIKLKLKICKGVVVLLMVRAADGATVQKVVNCFQQEQMAQEANHVNETFVWFGIEGGVTHKNDLDESKKQLARTKSVSEPKRGLFPSGMTVDDFQIYAKNRRQLITKSSRKFGTIFALSVVGAYGLRYFIADTAVQRCLLTMGLTMVIGPLGAIACFLRKF